MNSLISALFTPQGGAQVKGQPASPDQQKTALIEKAGGRVVAMPKTIPVLRSTFICRERR